MHGWQGSPIRGGAPAELPPIELPLRRKGHVRRTELMSEEAKKARQALQESMDLREQGHTDD